MQAIIDRLLGSNGLAKEMLKGTPAIPAYKSAVTSFQQFLKDNFDPETTNVDDFTSLRSNFIDELLKLAWRQYFGDKQSTLSLVAVGGYGRGELFPGSDVDLMIITRRLPSKLSLQNLQQFLTFLWDIGLEVGHSVRSVRTAQTEAKADITVVTNIMESRLLIGSEKLFTATIKACGPKKIWSSRPFFLAKYEEQLARYKKYDDTAYNLEPNLKESPGGLRDIQNISWVAKRHFGANSLEELVHHKYLTKAEYELLNKGQKYLSTVRMALHLITARREDRVLFDHQRTLATQFGFSGEGNEPIEKFMQQYFRTVIQLQRLNEMLLQHFQDDIDLKPRWGRKQIKPINKRFQSRRGFIETVDDKVFPKSPFALLEIFLILQQNPEIKGVTAATIRLIREHRELINDRYREDPRAKGFFMEILRQPQGITNALRRMNRYGVLAAYLPEFANIVGRMQYDLFHAYTVDEHTLFVVRNLRRFTVPAFKHEFPLCSNIMATLPKPELVYIAGLYHDIAKGRGGDHAELGGIDAHHFCKRHGLTDYDANMVSWLVESHLLMSQTSQKQDISDAETIHKFATKIADSVRLNYLYVLTVADMRATNPSLWNSWKANLLNELYNATNQLYRHGIGSAELKEDRLQARKKESREQLLHAGCAEEELGNFWARLPNNYFLRHSVDDIVWHASELLKRNFSPTPVICARGDSRRGVTAIFIYTNDQANLFARSCYALAKLNLNILDARILETNDSFILNTFIVHDEQGNPIKDPLHLKTIEKRIDDETKLKHTQSAEFQSLIPRILKHFAVKTYVNFEQNDNSTQTVIRLRTTDRPGILAQVGQVFVEQNIRIHSAQVATFGERVEDTFYVTTPDLKQITDIVTLDTIKNSIIDVLATNLEV